MRTMPPLAAPLFRSEGQAALLAAVLLAGDEAVGLADLAARARVPRSSAYKEVARLADAGLLSVKKIGRTWQISANPDSPLTAPVRQILAVAYGPAVLLTEELSKLAGVDAAVIFGSFAARAAGQRGPAPKDIDVLIVGDVDVAALYEAMRRIGRAVGRPVNPTVMSRAEWVNAVAVGQVFAREVTANPTISLVGSLQ